MRSDLDATMARSGLRDAINFEGSTFAEVKQPFRGSIDDYRHL
jgi:hypothetical protein